MMAGYNMFYIWQSSTASNSCKCVCL